MAKTKIILAGSIALDRIMVFDGLFKDLIQPDKLQVLSIGVLVDQLKETRGGVAANIAYNLALLGEKPVLLASVGKNGRQHMKDLAQLGIDVSKIHFSKEPTASFSTLNDKNDCQVGGFYPGAMADAKNLSFLPWKNQEVLAVISAHDPTQMMVQVGECQQARMRLFFDPGQQALVLPPADLRRGIQAAELLMVNDYELGLIMQKTGWDKEKIANQVKVLVVTLGGEGSEIYHGKTQQHVLAVKVKQVIDPTGAGDAFRAGFLYGYVRDWELKQAAQLGSTVASLVVAAHGTQEHQFTREEVSKIYGETYGQKIQL